MHVYKYIHMLSTCIYSMYAYIYIYIHACIHIYIHMHVADVNTIDAGHACVYMHPHTHAITNTNILDTNHAQTLFISHIQTYIYTSNYRPEYS